MSRVVQFATELQSFRVLRQELLQEHEGDYAVFVGEVCVGAFPTLKEAHEVGTSASGNKAFLVRKVTRRDATMSAPAFGLH